eukprot:1412667-Prymnesium_polylepis.1
MRPPDQHAYMRPPHQHALSQPPYSTSSSCRLRSGPFPSQRHAPAAPIADPRVGVAQSDWRILGAALASAGGALARRHPRARRPPLRARGARYRRPRRAL